MTLVYSGTLPLPSNLAIAKVDEGAEVHESHLLRHTLYFGTLVFFGGCRICKRSAGELVRLFPPKVLMLNYVTLFLIKLS